MTGTCTGACCAAFPLDGWSGRDHSKDEGEDAYINAMVVPLTVEEAKARFASLGYGDLGSFIPLEKFESDLYTCRLWDEATRLCTAYEARPRLCSQYPYWSPCTFCGFEVEVDVQRAWRARQGLFDYRDFRWNGRLGGYRPRDPALDYGRLAAKDLKGWRWDPAERVLYPINDDSSRWDHRRRKWEKLDVPDVRL